MSFDKKIEISNIPAISAIYFALLQCGYDYYSFERSTEHISAIKTFYPSGTSSQFFAETKQVTCDVYPFWPRAAMLETATFFLTEDVTAFSDAEKYYTQIMSAGNISDAERDLAFWEWVNLFPRELKKILISDRFKEYMEWECLWIQKQNLLYHKELNILKEFIDLCVERYHSPMKSVKVALSAIKCVYSCDYHLVGDCFVFSSGAFKIDSVIHEFLHHVVHPTVVDCKNYILANKRKYENIDASYYLSGDEDGTLNAFEEFLVCSLTERFLERLLPDDLKAYIETL